MRLIGRREVHARCMQCTRRAWPASAKHVHFTRHASHSQMDRRLREAEQRAMAHEAGEDVERSLTSKASKQRQELQRHLEEEKAKELALQLEVCCHVASGTRGVARAHAASTLPLSTPCSIRHPAPALMPPHHPPR